MKCPYCGSDNTRVIDSRPAEDNCSIRRRRLCDDCSKRFTTYEIIETVPVIVIKRDKSRQVFDRSKILSGLLRACEKRPVSIETLEKIVDEMEFTLQNSPDREVPSERIGELAMEKLKDIDEVAYVRFASVYRQFQDIQTFMDELKSMMKTK